MNKSYSAINQWPEDGLEDVLSCPVCGSRERTLIFDGLFDRLYGAPGVWKLQQCLSCKSAYLDPRPTPETIGLTYQHYFTHDSAANAEVVKENKNYLGLLFQGLRNGYLFHRYHAKLYPSISWGAFIVEFIPVLRERANAWVKHLPPPTPGATVLDVGCGNGAFLLQMQKLGWNVQGLEFDAKAAEAAQENGIPVVVGSLDWNTFPQSSFDAIVLNHVVEHLPYPRETIKICYHLLKPGGIISISTPNFDSIGRHAYKQNWLHLHPPAHLTIFTTRSLVKMLRDEGYQDVKARHSFGSSSYLSASQELKNESRGINRSSAKERIILSFYKFLASLASYFNPFLCEEAVVTASKQI